MRYKFLITIVFTLNIFLFSNHAFSWDFFSQPNVLVGGSAGYFRISFNDFDNIYNSSWSDIYSGHLNVRLYRQNYFTLQYAKFKNTSVKKNLENYQNAFWEEKFLNAGIRWYTPSLRKWNFYASFGLSFITITEQPGLSVFQNSSSEEKNGRGFFLEIGTDVELLPHTALFFEIEATSAGEGGTPGFIGHSIGGYAFNLGLDFHF